MHDLDTLETSAVVAEENRAESADPALREATLRAGSVPAVDPREAEALKAVYPDFDTEAALAHPELGALLRGEAAPTLRQLYEAVHLEEIVEARVADAVEAAVAAAVSEAVESAIAAAVPAAVREGEEKLLEHIRARGLRPAENGIRAATGVRMHPAVNRLTRRERAMLAKRAELGETVRL